jgi:hypothetical protein
MMTYKDTKSLPRSRQGVRGHSGYLLESLLLRHIRRVRNSALPNKSIIRLRQV